MTAPLVGSLTARLLNRAAVLRVAPSTPLALETADLLDEAGTRFPREQMTVDQFREAVGVERASHVARGYDTAHDRAHGVPHLLRWAIDYASRGEAVKSGALIVAALHLSEELEREERGVRARADQAEQERHSVIERVIELRDSTDADRYDVDDALMLRGHRAIDADDHAALTRDEWATYYTAIGRNGEATRILDHLAAIVSLRGAEYDLYTPPELDARKAN